jgi:hypothetical protein
MIAWLQLRTGSESASLPGLMAEFAAAESATIEARWLELIRAHGSRCPGIPGEFYRGKHRDAIKATIKTFMRCGWRSIDQQFL